MSFFDSGDNRINNVVRQIAESEKVNKVFLFGSRAKGCNLKWADIDLAVQMKDDASILDWTKIEENLEMNPKTLLEIDLVQLSKDGDKDSFEKRIIDEGILLYE
jgi:predicted nucleotidyltransferase